MKRYNADPAKQKQRLALKDMIQSTLLAFLKPEKVYPLCFPGIDGLEVIEVYNALGVPRKNVTCLERDNGLIPQIMQTIPGVNIPQQNTLENYLKANKSLPHNIVSLDFTQNISAATMNLTTLSACSIGHKNYVFHAAFQKAREHTSTQTFMSILNLHDELITQLVDKSRNITVSQYRKRSYNIEENRETALKSIWENVNGKSSRKGIAEELKALLGPKTNEIISKAIKKEAENFRNEGIEDLADDLIREVDEAKDISTHHHTLYYLTPAIMRETHEYVESLLYSQLLFAAKGSNATELGKHVPYWASQIVVSFIQRSNPNCFKLKKLHKYDYISESGAPMIGDIGFVVTTAKIRNSQDELLRHITPDLRVKDAYALVKAAEKCDEVGREVTAQTFDLDKYDTVERHFLGSSAKPILAKKQAIELLKSAKTQQEIIENYRIKPRRLAALKAHITMGTYNNQ